MPKIAIIMGSQSDLETMNEAAVILKRFGLDYEMKVLSAHRTPKEVAEYSENARKKGLKVIIAGAGGAAHLAGVIAAHTTLPVIGVPIQTKSLAGLDSLMSTVQMPGGVPVATMAIGSSGAKNAGILAVQILAVSDKLLSKKLAAYKKELADSVKKKR
jgi:phosphoribosylaminoimidazole carboxylase PurE protein